MLRKRSIFLYFIFLSSLIVSIFIPSLSQTPDVSNKIQSHQKSSPVRELQNDIDALLNNPDLSDAQIGVCIYSLDRGEYIYKKNETKNFNPASNLKLFTTAAALDLLTPEFRFVTKMYLDGIITENGEYNGNIVIRGSGDPTMSEYYYENPISIIESFVQALDSIGINSIRGNIIGDDRYFDGDYYAPGWAWDDLCFEWASQVNALSFFDNKVDITFSPSEKIGELTKYKISPENSYIQLINNIRTASSKELSEIVPLREQGSNIIEVHGILAIDSNFIKKENGSHSTINTQTMIQSVTIDNPTRFFLNLFKESLSKHIIKFRGALLDIDDWNEEPGYQNMKIVKEFESPSLSLIIPVINKVSHNLEAEMLLKTIGKESSGTGSFSKGTEYVMKFLAKAGIKNEKLNIVDGSGMSRYNLISPINIVSLLNYMYKSKYQELFISSLAEPGKKGTLSKRMTGSRAENNVHAKTGLLDGVSNLSGFITTRDGEQLTFSIMMMNFTAPQTTAHNLQDLICMRLASFSRK